MQVNSVDYSMPIHTQNMPEMRMHPPGIACDSIWKTMRRTGALQKIINSQIMLQAGKKSAPPHKLLP